MGHGILHIFYRHKALILVVVFASGFLCFWLGNMRFGPHPDGLRRIGAKSSFLSIMDTCDFGTSRAKTSSCLLKHFVDEIPRWGLAEYVDAATYYQSIGDHDNLAVKRCHDVVHQIGKASILNNLSTKEVLLSCTSLCQSGCFHGAALGWAAKGEVMGDAFTNVCLSPEIPTEKRSMCVHGMGHAVALLGLYDPHASLAYCDVYGADDRDNCGNGVFMELYDGTEFDYSPLRDQDIESPGWCAQFDAPYDEVCYSQYGYFEYSQTNDIHQAIAACKQAPIAYQFDCLTFIGKKLYFVYPLRAQDKADIAIFCQNALPTKVHECIEVVSTNYVE